MKTKNRKKLLLPIVLLVFLPSISGQSARKYPYISDAGENGPIIVSRDDKGGVHPDALAVNGNSIEEMFVVAKTDDDTQYNLTDVQNVCVRGWRLPTKRELQLVWLMGGAESEVYKGNVGKPVTNTPLNDWGDGFQALTADEYWTSTTGGWYVSFKDGKVANSTSGNRKVRCVRDYLYSSGTFAHSNIVIKDNKLIFAVKREGRSDIENGVYTTADIPANSQGVMFKWGSLVAISSDGGHETPFAPEHIVWWPKEYHKVDAWLDVPYNTNTKESYLTTEDIYEGIIAPDHHIEDWPIIGYDAENGVGDICRYISDQGWVKGRWRIPTAHEINKIVAESPIGEGVNDSGYANRGIPSRYNEVWENIEIKNTGKDGNYGMFPIDNGYWLGTGAGAVSPNSLAQMATPPNDNVIFIPAGAGRTYADGIMNYPGHSGQIWSSTGSDNNSYGFYILFNEKVIMYPRSHRKAYGFPIRCVAE